MEGRSKDPKNPQGSRSPVSEGRSGLGDRCEAPKNLQTLTERRRGKLQLQTPIMKNFQRQLSRKKQKFYRQNLIVRPAYCISTTKKNLQKACKISSIRIINEINLRRYRSRITINDSDNVSFSTNLSISRVHIGQR